MQEGLRAVFFLRFQISPCHFLGKFETFKFARAPTTRLWKTASTQILIRRAVSRKLIPIIFEILQFVQIWRGGSHFTIWQLALIHTLKSIHTNPHGDRRRNNPEVKERVMPCTVPILTAAELYQSVRRQFCTNLTAEKLYQTILRQFFEPICRRQIYTNLYGGRCRPTSNVTPTPP